MSWIKIGSVFRPDFVVESDSRRKNVGTGNLRKVCKNWVETGELDREIIASCIDASFICLDD